MMSEAPRHGLSDADMEVTVEIYTASYDRCADAGDRMEALHGQRDVPAMMEIWRHAVHRSAHTLH